MVILFLAANMFVKMCLPSVNIMEKGYKRSKLNKIDVFLDNWRFTVLKITSKVNLWSNSQTKVIRSQSITSVIPNKEREIIKNIEKITCTSSAAENCLNLCWRKSCFSLVSLVFLSVLLSFWLFFLRHFYSFFVAFANLWSTRKSPSSNSSQCHHVLAYA